MLVPDLQSLELALVVLVVHLVEDVLEAAVIGFQDGVFGAHVKRPLLHEGVLEASLGEVLDGLISVVHSESNTSTLEVIHQTPSNQISTPIYGKSSKYHT